MNPIVKYFVGTALRHLLTALFTLIIVNHYMGADIAVKLMHGDTVTLWNGYGLSINSIVDYLMAVSIPMLIPILWGTWVRIRSKFKIITALESTHTSDVTATVASTPVTEIISTVAKSPSI